MKQSGVLRVLAGAAVFFASLAASAESISEHVDEEGFSDWYWTTNVPCARSEAHTFCITGLTENTAITGLSVSYLHLDVEEGETNEVPYDVSRYYESEDGSALYALLSKEDWNDIPGTGVVSFTVWVSGWEPDENQTAADLSFAFRHSAGEDDFPIVKLRGTEANPVSFSIAESNTVQDCGKILWMKPGGWDENDYVDGCVYLSALSLKAGRKYVFGFKGLDSETSVSMLDADGNELFTDENACDTFSACDGFCWTVEPGTDGTCTIVVGDDSEDFFCKYAVYAMRKPAEHKWVDYGDGDFDAHYGTLAVGETSEPFVPGYLNHPASGACDEVIDTKLFELTGLAGGTNYVFETQDADTELMMRLYDGQGEILAENNYMSGGVGNVRIVWTAPANLATNDTYYVGVCARLEEGFEPWDFEVTLTARAVEIENGETTLAVVPMTEDGSPFDAEGAVPSEALALSASVWTNTCVIPVRKGVEYHVKARLTDDGDDGDLALAAQVRTADGTPIGAEGDLDPYGETDYLAFTAPSNGTVRLDVALADGEWGSGRGLDYGPFEVCAAAYGDLGILRVDMEGADEELMGWKILKIDGTAASGETFYAATESVILPEGTYTLLAKTVTGCATPDRNGFGTYEVVAGETTVAAYRYADKYDHRDDHPAGKIDGVTYAATTIAPRASGLELVRTLYADDPSDWFGFTATAGAYYKFALTETTGASEIHVYTSAVKRVTSEADLVEITDFVFRTDPASCIQFAATVRGTHYVQVTHAEGSEEEDAAYTLVATSANPGLVKFAKTAVTVKDSAGYADLSVSRTGREGVTRVDYTTAGEQSSAEDALYYPTTGTLVWEDGDNKAKTIRVKLVPQDYGMNRSFQVRLSAAAIEDEASEFPAVIACDTATVTVTPAAQAAPGTIRLADCTVPKNPVIDAKAGEGVLALALTRDGGADGTVSVKVETADKTAKKGRDYETASETFTWEDGDADARTFSIRLHASSDNVATKTFTVKLKAVSGKDLAKPTLAASTITVNLANDRFETTVAAYAKTLPKTGGIALRETKAGSWVVDADGSIRSTLESGTLTFTLTGPGVFTYAIAGAGEKQLVVPYGERKDNKVVISAGETLSWYRWEPMGDNLVTLRQCVKYMRAFTNGETKVTLKGKLPDGLKLAQDKATKVWSVSGTPTKAGFFQAIFAETRNGLPASVVTETNNYEVVAAGTAIGTFSGLVETSDTEDGLRSLASVTLTAAATGRLSAKALVGGKTYTFADTGYASCADDGDTATVTAELPLVQKIGSGKTAVTVTNWLTCSVVDAPETNALARSAGVACGIRFAKLADATGKVYDGDVHYEGTLFRDNSKVADWVTEASAFAGYYTVSLVVGGASDGEPKGSGYLTLTFDAKGKVKVAGLLADGTSCSASSVSPGLVERSGETAIRIPLYACKSPQVFGGWLELVPGGDGALVVSSDSTLVWANDAVTATRGGESGFDLTLVPVGGWYDTVRNLQKWFLEYDFSVDLPTWEEDSEGDLAALLPDGYAFAVNPCGQQVDLVGDAVSVEKRVLTKDAQTKLYDFGASVNAANVKISFTRATGVLSGTFDLWYAGYNAKTKKTEQKSITGLRHNGILLLSRGSDAELGDEIWTSGFYLVPQTLSYLDEKGRTRTRKWTGSYRFDIKATDAGRDWAATPAD